MPFIPTAGLVQPSAPPLYDSTLPVDTANWDVQSISQAYNHLLVIMTYRGTAASDQVLTQVRYNNDSGANYDWQQLYGSDSVASANGAPSVTFTRYGFTGGSTITAGLAGSAHILIPNYTGTTFDKSHSGTVFSPGSSGAASFAMTIGGRWRSSAAINRITIFPDAGNWKAGSRLLIYGLL